MPSKSPGAPWIEEQIAQDATRKTIEDTQIIRLSVEDQRTVAAAILNPPVPLRSLVHAAEAHNRLIRDRPARARYPGCPPKPVHRSPAEGSAEFPRQPAEG